MRVRTRDSDKVARTGCVFVCVCVGGLIWKIYVTRVHILCPILNPHLFHCRRRLAQTHSVVTPSIHLFAPSYTSICVFDSATARCHLCIVFAPISQRFYTVSVSSVHHLYIVFTPFFHFLRTVFTPLHNFSTQSLHQLYTTFTPLRNRPSLRTV